MSTQISKRILLGKGALAAGVGVGALALLAPQRASADTPFTSFPFPATGAPTPRTMPDRLADVKNVKDFGAVGNGTTDDTVGNPKCRQLDKRCQSRGHFLSAWNIQSLSSDYIQLQWRALNYFPRRRKSLNNHWQCPWLHSGSIEWQPDEWNSRCPGVEDCEQQRGWRWHSDDGNRRRLY